MLLVDKGQSMSLQASCWWSKTPNGDVDTPWV
jgi:hypothetical protein